MAHILVYETKIIESSHPGGGALLCGTQSFYKIIARAFKLPISAGQYPQDILRLPPPNPQIFCKRQAFTSKFPGPFPISLLDGGPAPVRVNLPEDWIDVQTPLQLKTGLKMNCGQVIIPPAMVQVAQFMLQPRQIALLR